MSDRWVEKFKKEALPKIEREFKPEKVLVFGSRAKGKAKETSDIDIIVVAGFFAKIPFLRRMPLVLRTVQFPKHVDYICYTAEEYERLKKESSVIMDAEEDSIELMV